MVERNSGTSNVAIVAIVVIVLLVIGFFIYFWGFKDKRNGTTIIEKPDVEIEQPYNTGPGRENNH